MIILDTSYLISLFRGDDRIAAIADVVDADEPSLTTITHFEIFRSRHKMGNKEKAYFSNIFAIYEVMSFDSRSSESASNIQSSLDRIGTKVNVLDVMIAGTMIGHGISRIATFDSDFENIRKVADIEIFGLKH